MQDVIVCNRAESKYSFRCVIVTDGLTVIVLHECQKLASGTDAARLCSAVPSIVLVLSRPCPSVVLETTTQSFSRTGRGRSATGTSLQQTNITLHSFEIRKTSALGGGKILSPAQIKDPQTQVNCRALLRWVSWRVRDL